MRKTKVLWMLMLTCMVGFCFTSCSSRDDDEDDETYQVRNYIIGVGKWNVKQVKKADGTWADFPFGEGLSFMIEFFDKKGDSNERKFKSWEIIGETDPNTKSTVYEGVYTVNKKTVVCTVDGKPHLKLEVNQMQDRYLGGILTFYNENRTFEVIMERVW